ncbi:MAG: efflux RND transporter periplasmic adaptor subunit [Pseudomonadota bacterium]
MNLHDKRLLGGAAGIALVAALGGFGIARWTAAPAPVEAPAKAESEHEESTDSIAMTADAIKVAAIGTETVTAGGLGAEILSQATVTASTEGEAIVTARASGTVIRVFKRLGDPVRAGEALAIVESREASQIAAERTSTAARLVQAQRALARERYLYQQKVSARVTLEAAEADAAAAAAEARRAQLAAQNAKITGDGRGVILASPISGRITSQNVTLGAFVQPEAEMFRISDPRRIQIEAAVGPADAARLAPGDRAIVEIAGGTTIEARVRAVTPTLSGETRSATALLDVDGASLQPGLAVRVRLMPSRGGSTTAIVVPEEAVQSVEGKDVVFVRTPEGFRAVPVKTGQRSAGRIEIVSGLTPGQTIATTNAFLLKAELGKSAGEEH